MGWTGYESTISLGMIYRKMYCHKCAYKLVRKKISNVYEKGDPNYKNHTLGNLKVIGMSKIKLVYYIYECPNCHSTITYEEQRIIQKKQKKLGKILLSEIDLDK